MKRLNRHYIKRFRFLLVLPIAAILVFCVLWFSGWFEEMKYIGSGYRGGTEESSNGHFFRNIKGRRDDYSIEFTSVEGTVYVKIYDTGREEPKPGLADDSGFIEIDSIEVTEPTTVEFDTTPYPEEHYCFVQVEAEEGAKCEYRMSFESWRSRGRDILVDLGLADAF